MSRPGFARVGVAELLLLEPALYADAHPGESAEPGERCSHCAWALRLDTHEIALLWLAGEKDWTVSRADPHWARHRADFAKETAAA